MGVVDVLLKVFKDPNERKISKVMPVVEHINHLEEEFMKLSDDELKAKTAEFKEILSKRETSADFKTDRALEKEALDKESSKVAGSVIELGEKMNTIWQCRQKIILAFANGSGVRIVFGVENGTLKELESIRRVPFLLWMESLWQSVTVVLR